MIPDFQSIMLPLLEILRDGTGKITSEIREGIISHFNISEVEQLEKIPSGKRICAPIGKPGDLLG